MTTPSKTPRSQPPRRLELPKVGETIEGRYLLKEALSSGGMGVVMRAEHSMMGRDVAVKILHAHIASEPGFTERFKREVRVSTLFSHPNITRVYDFGETAEGTLYLVMELLQGQELKHVIEREGPLTVGRTFALGLQILEGLAEAHSAGVVHRDLKPSNIFVVSNRRGQESIKLLDFGIARLTDSSEVTLTGTGMIAGTPSYMAPELLLGQPPGKGVDVYAVGLILLEMLTGQRVFDGQTMARNLLMQLKKPVPIPAAFDRIALGAVLRKATCKHPDDRYADAEEMLEALQRAEPGSPAELRLTTRQIPAPVEASSSSIWGQVAEQGNNLEILRRAPQHEAVPTAPPKPAGTEVLSREDIEFLAESKAFDETFLSREDSPETALIRADPTSLTTAIVEPPRATTLLRRRTPATAKEHDDEAFDEGLAGMGVFSTGRSSKGWMLRAMGGAAVVVVVLVAMVLWPDAEDLASEVLSDPLAIATSEPLEVEQESVPSVKEGVVEGVVESVPAGARLFVGDELKGVTPMSVEMERERFPTKIRLEHAGYEPLEVELTELPGETLMFRLEAAEAAPQASTQGTPIQGAPIRRSKPRETKPRETKPRESQPRESKTEQDRIDSVLDRYLPEL